MEGSTSDSHEVIRRELTATVTQRGLPASWVATYWARLLSEARVDELLCYIGTLDDLADDIEAWALEDRLERRPRPGSTREARSVAPRLIDRARSLLAVHDAETEGAVQMFRDEVLNGEFIGPSAAEAWKTSASRADVQRLIELAYRLHTRLPWSASEVERYLLTGRAPLCESVTIETEGHVGERPRVRFVITVDPETPPKEVERAYREARARLIERYPRTMKESSLELAIFAASRRPHASWDAIWRAWNRARPDAKYDSAKALARDANRVFQRLRSAPYGTEDVIRVVLGYEVM